MRNLLSANFLRLKKSILFWGTLIFMAGYALWQIRFWTEFRGATIDPMIFDYAGAIGIVSAVWSSLFLSTDYSDGTLRNKLMAGHSRNSIYFVNLITNMLVALLQCAAYLAVTFSLGVLWVGPPTIAAGRILSLLAGTLAMTAATCSILTAIGMLCSQKAVAAVVCIAGSFALFGYMSSVDSYLNVPKYSSHIEVHEDGHVDVFYQLNKDGYVTGMRRTVFEFLDDVLPSGQAVQYMRNWKRDIDPVAISHFSAEQLEEYIQYQRPPVDPLPLILYSLAVTAAVTAIGAALFRQKDLK